MVIIYYLIIIYNLQMLCPLIMTFEILIEINLDNFDVVSWYTDKLKLFLYLEIVLKKFIQFNS